VLVGLGALVLLADERGSRKAGASFDSQGAVLVTGGMLLLVFGLVRAPIVGWASAQTIAVLVVSAALLIAFSVNEARTPDPLLPGGVLRVKGLLAADATQLLAFCGFFSLLFFATLYMQEVLHYSPVKAGLCYLPITGGFAVAGAVASQLITRIGARPVVVAGCLVSSAGIFLVSRVPINGSYARDLLPGFLVMSLGAGLVFVSVAAAANAGVKSDQAGLAAGLLNSSQQVGSALGLAVLSAIAITHTHSQLKSGVPAVVAADHGYHLALLTGSVMMAAAAAIAVRIGNTKRAAPIVMVSSDRPEETALVL
jgi:predicted MFS family arabinose efflux permease